MAQVVEHVLGKDEVTSSNLVSSSKSTKSSDLVLFFYVSRLMFIPLSFQGESVTMKTANLQEARE
jgi:hypothetical protein